MVRRSSDTQDTEQGIKNVKIGEDLVAGKMVR